MIKISRWLRILALAGLTTSICQHALADAVVTLAGKEIQGRIVSEDDEEIALDSEYGQLRFQKHNLKAIIRGSGASAIRVDLVGGMPGSGAAVVTPTPIPGNEPNPFGGSSETNPFGGAAATGGEASSGASANPFSTAPAEGNPFAPRSGSASSNPLGAAQGEAAAQPIVVPAVQFGYDGVVYGISEEHPVLVKARPDQAGFTTTAADTPVVTGGEVQTRDSRARIVLKNNQDIVRLPPETHIKLVQLTESDVTIELVQGSVWSEVSSRAAGGSFTVRTPNVTAGVVGTVFRMSDQIDQGVNIAVLEGSVLVGSELAQITASVPQGNMVNVAPNGSISPLMPLDERIKKEYEGWDQWAQDSSAALGGFGMGVGGGAADAIIQQTAQDNAAWASMMQEGNYMVSLNRLDDFLGEVGKAFEKFAADTGHVPTSEEGFTVLRENVGGWVSWNGPYWEGQLPPPDAWGRPLKYTMKVSPQSGNVYGVVYSIGEDARDNKGQTPNDMARMVLFHQIPAIKNNPEYAPETLKQQAP